MCFLYLLDMKPVIWNTCTLKPTDGWPMRTVLLQRTPASSVMFVSECSIMMQKATNWESSLLTLTLILGLSTKAGLHQDEFSDLDQWIYCYGCLVVTISNPSNAAWLVSWGVILKRTVWFANANTFFWNHLDLKILAIVFFAQELTVGTQISWRRVCVKKLERTVIHF